MSTTGGDFPWPKASEFRDWMINREGTDYPSDASHEKRYRDLGAEPLRGTARLDGPGAVLVSLRDGGERRLSARDIIVGIGTHGAASPTSSASTGSTIGPTAKRPRRASCRGAS